MLCSGFNTNLFLFFNYNFRFEFEKVIRLNFLWQSYPNACISSHFVLYFKFMQGSMLFLKTGRKGNTYKNHTITSDRHASHKNTHIFRHNHMAEEFSAPPICTYTPPSYMYTQHTLRHYTHSPPTHTSHSSKHTHNLYSYHTKV